MVLIRFQPVESFTPFSALSQGLLTDGLDAGAGLWALSRLCEASSHEKSQCHQSRPDKQLYRRLGNRI